MIRTKFSNRIIDFDVKSNAKYSVATDTTEDKINTMKLKLENLEDLSKKGVYKITNLVNNKFYIGDIYHSV